MSAAMWRTFDTAVGELDDAISSARSAVVRAFDADATDEIDAAADRMRRCADALVSLADRMRSSPVAQCAWFPVRLSCRHYGACTCAEPALRIPVALMSKPVEVPLSPARRRAEELAKKGLGWDRAWVQLAAWNARSASPVDSDELAQALVEALEEAR